MITCWERIDLLAFSCVMFPCVLSLSHMVPWVIVSITDLCLLLYCNECKIEIHIAYATVIFENLLMKKKRKKNTHTHAQARAHMFYACIVVTQVKVMHQHCFVLIYLCNT